MNWNIMDLRRLHYFATVARLGSFTRAAEALRISQPPLSQRIQELEDEVGSILIDRASRPLQLTVAGQLLYRQAVDLLQKTDAMMASMRRLASNERPTLRLGLVSANFHASLSGIIRLYRHALPDADIQILEMNSVEQVDALREGSIDAGIGRIDLPAEGISRIILYEEPMIAALPYDHPLALMEGAVPLEALKDEPFIVYTNDHRPSLADHLLAEFSKRGIALSRIDEIAHFDSALILIAAGSGLSIVPESARMIAFPGVTYRPIAELIVSPMVFSHREDDRAPTLRALYAVLIDFLRERGHAIPATLQA